MTEPTDAELDELRQANSGRLNFVTFGEFRTIARAVLAKWGVQPLPASQGDELDAARLDWLDEDDGSHVSKVGKTWYTRPTYGRPYRKHKNLRAAIDAARAAQEGK